VDLDWDGGKVREAVLHAALNHEHVLRAVPGQSITANVALDKQADGSLRLKVKRGQSYRLKFGNEA
jgi:hypothetical protein